MHTESAITKTKVFRGGIQKGTKAWDDDSLALDNLVGKIAKELSKDPDVIAAGYVYQYKLKQDQMPCGVGACKPDGGVWFKYDDLMSEGKLVAAFEAKKQNDAGNAEERWYDNATLLREINKDINYVTFVSGSAAYFNGRGKKNGAFGKSFARRVWNKESDTFEFNQYREGKDSIYLSINGHEENEVRSIMRKALGV
jgi:hypothetical protein